MRVRFAPILICLFFSLLLPFFLSAQILWQNFDDLESLEDFQAAAPGQGQVDRLNLDPASEQGASIFSLGSEGDNQFLQIDKKTDQRRHFDRVSGIADEDFLIVSFRFAVQQVDVGKRFAAFMVGRNFYQTSSFPIRDERWAQFGIHINSDGSFFLANEARENVITTRTGNFTGEQQITLVMNNSGQSLNYAGPGGDVAEIQDKKVEVWVGEERLIINAAPYLGPSANISTVKFILWNNDQTASARMDDLLISRDPDYFALPVDLPVSLIDFTAKAQQNHVMLSWRTGMEKNSSHFEVERSTDAENFVFIGMVHSGGESRQIRNYELADKQEGAEQFSGSLYYRLKMVDLDGTFEYSPLRHVFLTGSFADLTIGPNPFKDQLLLELKARQDQFLKIELLDLKGKMMVSQQQKLQQGEAQIWLQELGHLPPGLYLLKLSAGFEHSFFRLVKL